MNKKTRAKKEYFFFIILIFIDIFLHVLYYATTLTTQLVKRL